MIQNISFFDIIYKFTEKYTFKIIKISEYP